MTCGWVGQCDLRLNWPYVTCGWMDLRDMILSWPTWPAVEWAYVTCGWVGLHDLWLSGFTWHVIEWISTWPVVQWVYMTCGWMSLCDQRFSWVYVTCGGVTLGGLWLSKSTWPVVECAFREMCLYYLNYNRLPLVRSLRGCHSFCRVSPTISC